ncbi:MAG: GIY-YIG nuclease family protein [Tenuifilaceae bacterium]|jgi:putative endonuclease|nr:GIY-YIG nuclease family protein [Tenuifilaceae bacterium]MDY0254783.1 GIY-YIG nuclease family protein [Tenuifilaceae bacterium]
MDNLFFVYALVSQIDGRIYVGMSQNVRRRLSEHNQGKVQSTRPYTPWRLFFSEPVGDSEQARIKEKYYKTASGKRKLRAILASKENTA